MMRAELDALIASGPRRGKQFTYALLDERAPPGRTLARDEALAELAGRYFASHGPALPQDFAWWSGLTVGDAKPRHRGGGARASRPRPSTARPIWFAPGAARRTPRSAGAAVHLLPNYDEVIVAYRDHGPSLAPGMPQTFKDRAGGGRRTTSSPSTAASWAAGAGWRRRAR